MTKDNQEYFPSEEIEQEEERKQKLLESGKEVVELDEPVKIGGKEVTSITVRKPRAGELRGISLVDLLQLDFNTLNKVLPRVTTPMLHSELIKNLDPADLLQLGTAVTGFLLSKKLKE